MLLVIIESPFAGDTERNIKYARLCLKDSLLRGEAPLASHLLYTQQDVLDDTKPEEREKGITAGLEWAMAADRVIVYEDLGITPGMERGIENAKAHSVPVEYRKIL